MKVRLCLQMCEDVLHILAHQACSKYSSECWRQLHYGCLRIFSSHFYNSVWFIHVPRMYYLSVSLAQKLAHGPSLWWEGASHENTGVHTMLITRCVAEVVWQYSWGLRGYKFNSGQTEALMIFSPLVSEWWVVYLVSRVRQSIWVLC